MIPSYLYVASFPTGSSYVCDPPVLDTDIDEMHLVYNLQEVESVLLSEGWSKCSEKEYTGNDWKAFRKGNLNALVTDNTKYFQLFQKATETAKKLNLRDKKDRIDLFEYLTGRK